MVNEAEINKIPPVVNVLPITTRKPDWKIYPNQILLSEWTAGLEEESMVLCYKSKR